jgi:arginase
MLLDSGAVDADDVALVGARNLDPPEVEFIAASGLHTGAEGVERALAGADGVYAAVDFDGLDPEEVAVFMPEPDGLSVAEAESLLRRVGDGLPVAGAGFTGLAPDERNVEPLGRLAAALGL